MSVKRIIVLISGSGTNLQAIIDATRSGTLDCTIELVVSNRKAAFGLTRAREAGIPTLYFPLKPYTDARLDRAAFDRDLAERLNALSADVIVLAGWMHVFTPAFLETITARVINLHPALPGQFPGSNGIADQFAAYLRGAISEGGCMVHEVVAELDAGPVIGQSIVPFLPGDTLETFAARLHAAEHLLIVESTRRVLAGEV